MKPATRVKPTPGQMEAAFASERKPHWPRDLASALADPLFGRIVHMHAVLLAMGRDPNAGNRVNHRPDVIAPEPPHQADAPELPQRPRRQAAPRRAPAPSPALSPLPFFDRKRAAGGDDD